MGNGETLKSPLGRCRCLLALALAAIPVPLFADTILLTFHSIPGAVSITGEGTDVAIANFGTVSASGGLAAGLSRTTTASDFTISTQFGVRVVRILGTTASYTLQARLATPPPITWRIDGVALTTNPGVVAMLQPYDAILAHTLAMVVPFAFTGGAVGTVVEVTAIAN